MQSLAEMDRGGAGGCRELHPARSCDQAVFIDQTEDGVAPLQLCRHGITGWWWRVRREWSLLTQRTVRPVSVVMGDVFGEYGLEMSKPEDQHPVEALATHSPYAVSYTHLTLPTKR